MGACPSRAQHQQRLEPLASECEAGLLVPEQAGNQSATPRSTKATLGSPIASAILGDARIRVRDEILSPSALSDLLEAVKACSYFGKNSTENNFFKGTCGFHVKFRNTHRTSVETHLPFLPSVFNLLLRPECNTFYFNVFFARPDGQEYHVDNHFTDFCGRFRPTDFVSVLYLYAPESMNGGELMVLNKGLDELTIPPKRGQEEHMSEASVLQKIRPRTGRLVEFDGTLLHAVNPFELPPHEARVSIVVEQCKLPRRHFLQCPKFSIFCQSTNQTIVMER